MDADFFKALSAAGLVWGFVSGAEPPSARYVLEQRLGLINPPLVAMGDAPDKPNPQGLIQLASQLLARHGCSPLGHGAPPVAYLGDTVADVQTRVKMGQTSNVFALVKAGGSFYMVSKEIKVTLGGCGG